MLALVLQPSFYPSKQRVLYLIMIHVDNPVFKEILWEWRAFAIKVDPNIYRNILDLPLGW